MYKPIKTNSSFSPLRNLAPINQKDLKECVALEREEETLADPRSRWDPESQTDCDGYIPVEGSQWEETPVCSMLGTI